MANKKQLVAIAKKLGLDADLTWKKSEIQEAIDRAEAEIAELESEKTTDDETEEKPAEKKVEVDVGIMKATVSAGPDGELGTEDDEVDIKLIQTPVEPVTPDPEPVEPEKTENGVPIIREKIYSPPPPAPEPKAISGTYKCISGLTWQGNVYDIGDTVVMDDESAKVHVRDKSIGPVDAIQAKAERAKMLSAGDYKLVYDLTLEGHLHKMGETITLTEKQANLYEEIGVIEPR